MYAKAEIDRLKASGEIGKMTYVRILMPSGDWVAGGFNDLIRDDSSVPPLEWDPPAPDMNDEVRNQYNGFVNYYIHQINLMRYLLGEPYTRHVCRSFWCTTGRAKRERGRLHHRNVPLQHND